MEDVIQQHPAIWILYRANDGERSMTYEGARVRCRLEDCPGFSNGLECPQGCGVQIESDQAERDQRYKEEMRQRDFERKAWREQMRAKRDAR